MFAIKKHSVSGIKTGKWKTTSFVLLCLTVRSVHSVTVRAKNWTIPNKMSNPRTPSVGFGATARLKTSHRKNSPTDSDSLQRSSLSQANIWSNARTFPSFMIDQSVTWLCYAFDVRRIMVWFLDRRRFSLSQSVQTGSRAHLAPDPYLRGNSGSFLSGRAARHPGYKDYIS